MPESEEPSNPDELAPPFARRANDPGFPARPSSQMDYHHSNEPPEKYQPRTPIVLQIGFGIAFVFFLCVVAGEGPPKFLARHMTRADYSWAILFIGVGFVLFMRLKYRWRGFSGLVIAISCILLCLWLLVMAICSSLK